MAWAGSYRSWHLGIIRRSGRALGLIEAGDTGGALTEIKACLAAVRRSQWPDRLAEGMILEDLGAAYFRLGLYQLAIAHATMAMDNAEELQIPWHSTQLCDLVDMAKHQRAKLQLHVLEQPLRSGGSVGSEGAAGGGQGVRRLGTAVGACVHAGGPSAAGGGQGVRRLSTAVGPCVHAGRTPTGGLVGVGASSSADSPTSRHISDSSGADDRVHAILYGFLY